MRSTTAGRADTLYVYDALGNPVQSGLDIDGNGALEAASSDRISASHSRYVQIDGQWWQETVQQVYPAENAATAVTTAIHACQHQSFESA